MSYGLPKIKRTTVTADGAVSASGAVLYGVSAMGGTAFVYDDASAATAANFVAACAQNDTHWFGPNGVRCANGIYVDLTTGPAVIYWGAE